MITTWYASMQFDRTFLFAVGIVEDQMRIHAASEDSDKTERMCKQI